MAYDKDYEKFENWKSKKEKPWNRFIKNLEPRHYIIIVLLVGLLFLLIQNKDKGTRNTLIVICIMVVVIIIFLAMKSGESLPITAEQAGIIAEEFMKSKRGHEYPTGTRVERTGYCALRERKRDEPYRWEIGIDMIYPDGKVKELMIAIHPYTGNVTKVMETPAGWNATESPDMRPLFPFDYYKEVPSGTAYEEE